MEREITSGFNCVCVTPFTNSVYSDRVPAAYYVCHLKSYGVASSTWTRRCCSFSG